MTEVWFVRHGQSSANAGLATASSAEVTLTPLGEQQARQVAEAFTQAPDLIVTSKYTRAIQTAQFTIERFPGVPVENWDMHEFSYLSPEIMGGGHTTYEQRRPFAQDYWDRYDPTYIHGPGAESFAQMIGRIETMQAQIRDSRAKFIAIFGHGMFGKAILWANLLGSFDVTSEYMRHFHIYIQSFEIPNGGIIKATYTADEVRFGRIVRAHLTNPGLLA